MITATIGRGTCRCCPHRSAAEEEAEQADADRPQRGADHVGGRRTCGCGMRPAPASIGTIVRTNGMKRAITTARGAALVRRTRAPARDTSVLKIAGVGLEERGCRTSCRSSSRSARRRPRPGTIRSRPPPRLRCGSLPPALSRQKNPAMKRRESPGNGTGSTPDSRNTTRIRPDRPEGVDQVPRAEPVDGEHRRSTLDACARE